MLFGSGHLIPGPQILGQNFNITASPKVICTIALSHKKEKEKASQR